MKGCIKGGTMKKLILLIIISFLITGCKQDTKRIDELNRIIEVENKTIDEQKNSITDLQSRLETAEKIISEFESMSQEKNTSEHKVSIDNYLNATYGISEKFVKAYVDNDIETMKQYVAEYISISTEEIIIDLNNLDMYGLPPKEVKTLQVPTSSNVERYVFERFVYDEINNIQYYEYGLIYDEKYGIESDLHMRINAQGVVTFFAIGERGI